ncbi:hypothetical protein K440DRAFT_614502 [Wilcoxina mikolae CBS 423.85]|nr:hypothetical protein K440DRAFT_614502 [Wilcoxina mikolae CBS 423.85]
MELPEEKTLEERFVRWEELRRPRVEASYREAARVFEGVREISWWWNVVREWLYWFFLGLFMRHTNQAFLYDVSKVPL